MPIVAGRRMTEICCKVDKPYGIVNIAHCIMWRSNFASAVDIMIKTLAFCQYLYVVEMITATFDKYHYDSPPS